jgi:hypothetical protein
MRRNDGGLFFPSSRYEEVTHSDGNKAHVEVTYPGVSLRDWFAGQALARLISGDSVQLTSWQHVAAAS